MSAGVGDLTLETLDRRLCTVSSAESSTLGEQMEQLYDQYSRLCAVMAVSSGDEYAEVSDALEKLAQEMDDLMGVTPDMRRADARADYEAELIAAGKDAGLSAAA